jgi:gliding motility-associated-like protein
MKKYYCFPEFHMSFYLFFMRSGLLFFLFLVFDFSLFSQSSFSVDVDFGSPSPGGFANILLNYLEQDEQEDIWLLGRTVLSYDAFAMEEDPMTFFHLNSQGIPVDAYAVGVEGVGLFLPLDYHYENGYHAYIFRSPGGTASPMNYLVAANFMDSVFWSRRTTNVGNHFGPLRIKGDRIFYYQNGISNSSGGSSYPSFIGVGCSKMQNGQIIWSNNYTPEYSTFPDGLFPVDFNVDIEGNISVLGLMEGYNADALRFVAVIDSSGLVLNSLGFTNSALFPKGHLYDTAGNLVIFGTINSQPGSQFYGDASFILKFSPDLEFLWGKRLEAEHFDYLNMDVSAFPDGRLFFVYATPGDLPVLAGEISPEGELLDYRGYSFFDPLIRIGADQSIYFASPTKYLPDGSKEYAPLLAKTDSEGNIEGCPGYSACLELLDIEVTPFALTWEVEEAPVLPMENVVTENFSITATPYCGSPEPPSPVFFLPDTVCQSTCLYPDSLRNRLAHQVEWRISGPGLDTLVADSTFSYCFDHAGTYAVAQTVWLLGCAYSSEREVVVLPPLEAWFNQPDTLCGEPPVMLGVEASRALRSWMWDDGSAGPERPVLEDGQYAVTVSDGYCTAAVSAGLVLGAGLLEDHPIQLPADTTVCEADLPFGLEAWSPYPLEFTLLNDGRTGRLFSLAEAGEYVLQAEWQGCPYTAVFRLYADPCLGQLYWPSVFSPNGDGINDRWAPLGPEYELLELQIYDRWGSLILEDRTAPVDWDGRQVVAGVYVAVVRYRHRLSGEEGVKRGEVMVVR